MRLGRMVGVIAAVGALMLSGAGFAQGEVADTSGAAPQVGKLAPVAWVNWQQPDTASVIGSYKCSGPSDVMHLWVSVKQGGPDPTAEGSSSTVDAWYDTNISQDVQVKCNGRWQVTRVDLGQHPTDFTGRPLTRLHNGKAWLQFCLVAPGDDPSNPEDGIVASQSRWVKVVGAR